METTKNRDIHRQTIRISGMTCLNCQNRIEKKLKSIPGIKDAAVNYAGGSSTLTWNPAVVSLHDIQAAIETLGYKVLDERAETPLTEIIGVPVIILSLYILLHNLWIRTLIPAFPLAQAGIGYSMVFVMGLITSLHCVAMCGGINLSQTLRGGESLPRSGGSSPSLLLPSVLYNAGRVISYTAAGIIAGALGSIITVSGRFQGTVQLAAGAFMVIMGINILGIFPALRSFNPRLPRIFAKKIEEQQTGSKGPLIIGLLNGLMPCGPLQAMQIYALSTGNPIAGGLSMFLFSMGTAPLMFGLGTLSTLLSKQFGHTVMKIGAILVTVMGMTMFTYGWDLSAFNMSATAKVSMALNPFAAKNGKQGGSGKRPFTPVIENGIQIVNSTVIAGRYPAITVQQGIPVKWTINASAGSINGCNNRMIIREYGIEHRFQPGDNVIEFNPVKAGTFPYSCWMGMIRSRITVAAEEERIAGSGEPDLSPIPAGVDIPTNAIALAQAAGNSQTVTIELRDDGINPAIIVVQQGIPVLWTISNNSLDPGNSHLIFPAYYSKLDMKQGDNSIQFMPGADFDFSTADHIFYGYVKVVKDLDNLDMDAIKEDVSQFETMIYPEAYFKAAGDADPRALNARN